MNTAWISIVASLLSVAVFLIRRMGAAEQRKLGENNAVLSSMQEIAKRTGVAKKIAGDLKHANDDTISDLLRDDFRD